MGAKKLENSEQALSQETGVIEKQEILSFLKMEGNKSMLLVFTRLNQVSNLKGVWSITKQWVSIIAAMVLAKYFGTWWSYFIAICVISTRQHALGIIMHEATHWRLFTKKWANELIGNIFCAFPTNMVVSRYRHEHLLHHRYNMQEMDPYKHDWVNDSHWHWPKTKAEVSWLFFKDLFNLNMGHLGPTLFRWSPWANHFSKEATPPVLTKSERLSLYGFFTAVTAGLILSGAWLDFFLLWMLPMSTLTVVYVRARSAVEHINLPGENEYNRSRHVDANLIEKLTIAPLNINIHIAHHLFPSVPQYNLPELHKLLMQFPKYKENGRIYDSYFGLGKRAFDEMIVPKDRE